VRLRAPFVVTMSVASCGGAEAAGTARDAGLDLTDAGADARTLDATTCPAACAEGDLCSLPEGTYCPCVVSSGNAICSGGIWCAVYMNPPAPTPGVCLAQPTPGAACTEDNAFCRYACSGSREGEMFCQHGRWCGLTGASCQSQNPPDPCPAALPVDGSPCSSPVQYSCYYPCGDAGPGLTIQATCSGTSWSSLTPDVCRVPDAGSD
jgi:hypothetical protein